MDVDKIADLGGDCGRGLGKTLQSVALVWTLLKQNPYADPNHPGVYVYSSLLFSYFPQKEEKAWP